MFDGGAMRSAVREAGRRLDDSMLRKLPGWVVSGRPESGTSSASKWKIAYLARRKG
jgi:hypothetical protein